MTFEELGIAPDLCRAIDEMGFINPMPVQEKVIPILLENKQDLIALAQTGTGKTAAFGLPLLQQVDPKDKNTQAVILAPTRELCMQIAGDLNDYAKYLPDVKILAVYGGASIENQINALKRGVQIIVATPGRLIDLMQRKNAKLNSVLTIVLDEADEMLKMGFTDSINTILADIPESKQTLLFSATMPPEIAAITKNYMKSPIEITIGNKNSGADNVRHVCVTVHAKDKYLALKRICDYNPNVYGIVFCRTRIETQEVADKLIKDGYNADSLHGDLSQAQRDAVMQKFRFRTIRLLIATDVAARGLDVDDLTHVINYNLPDDHEVYTHRSGRTGRAGKAGTSVAIINLKERHLIRRIEKLIKKTFINANVPSGKEICEKQLFHLIDKMEKVELDHTQIDPFLPVIYKKLEFIEKEELIKRFVSLEFNRFLEYYKNAVDLSNPEERMGERGRDRNDRANEEGFTRIFINIGKMDDIWPKDLMELINSNNEGQRIPFGKIDILQKFTFFEVDSKFAKQVIDSMSGIQFKNVKIAIEEAQPRDNSGGGERRRRPEGGSGDGFRRDRSGDRSGERRSEGRRSEGRRSDDRKPERSDNRKPERSDSKPARTDSKPVRTDSKPSRRSDEKPTERRYGKPSESGGSWSDHKKRATPRTDDKPKRGRY